MGSLVAHSFACRFPERVAALVLIGSTNKVSKDVENAVPVAEWKSIDKK